MIIGFVLLGSCFLYINNGYKVFHNELIWIVEPFGLIYGILLARYRIPINKLIGNYKYLGTFFFSSLLLGVMYLVYKPVPIWGDYILKITLGFSLICFIMNLISRLDIHNRYISLLASLSFEIYLIHGIVISILRNYDISSGVFILLTITLSIIIAFPVNWVSNKLTNLLRYKKTEIAKIG